MATIPRPKTKRSFSALAIGVSLALAAVGCGGGDDSSSDAASTPTVPAAETEKRTENQAAGGQERAAGSSRRGSTVKVMKTRFGRILVNGRGRVLYLFTRERGKPPSRCYGDCAVEWPPFHTSGRPRAGSGAKAGLLGTAKRRNGRTQVTYNGHPLYYYVGDTEPGQVGCQNVTEFGGVWLVVSPSGSAIR